MNKFLLKKCKKIKILVTDVDGVLTDGGMYYSKDGEILKKFHTRDGMGVELLSKNKIKSIIMTREKSVVTQKRAKKIKVSEVYIGILKKELQILKVCKKFKANLDEIAYIGDDVNDLKLIKKVGFSAAPSDGMMEVKKIVDYVCKKNGGNGVFREVVDMIIFSKKKENLL